MTCLFYHCIVNFKTISDMRSVLILTAFQLVFLSLKAEYFIRKTQNDFCATSVYEGTVKIYATGNSGPYTITNAIGTELGTISSGQTNKTIGNLKWGTHTFTVMNNYGCKYDLSIEILKVNCGTCPTSSDRNFDDYLFTSSSTITGLSAFSLKQLKKYFTSDFIIDSDIPQGKICVEDQCIYSNSIGTGKIMYSNLRELRKRLKNLSNTLTVELEDQWGNPVTGTYSFLIGRMTFSGLQSGSYTLKVLLTNSKGTKIISTKTLQVLQKNCSPKSIKALTLSNQTDSTMNSLTNNWDIYAKQLNNGAVIEDSADYASLELMAYPNPFKTYLTVNIKSSNLFNGSLVMLNALGEEVEVLLPSQNIGNKTLQIDLNKLPNGVYQLAILVDELKVVSTRIVKIK